MVTKRRLVKSQQSLTALVPQTPPMANSCPRGEQTTSNSFDGALLAFFWSAAAIADAFMECAIAGSAAV